jgi:hypothetical protein
VERELDRPGPWRGVAEMLVSLLAYGGIQNQIVDGETGILLENPLDLGAHGAAVRELVNDPARAEALGLRAKERVRDRYLGTRSLIQAIELYERHILSPALSGQG